ncbi:MAG: murein biosynthesis integral membrane protein MurJ [Candidatus Sulfotelmatobacter sp.]
MTGTPSTSEPGRPGSERATQSRWVRALGMLRPSHAHSVFSATVVLMASTLLSSVFGLVRNLYIAWMFGRGMEADAFLAAFTLPDMISYFLVGGAASITFVTILTRYRDSGREAMGERSLSVILTSMFVVLGAAIVLAEIFAPWYVHWWFNGFDAKKAALCIRLTRILLPAQLFFFAGGVFGAVLLVRKQFNVQAVAPLIYNLGTIVGGILLVRRLGVSSLAIGTVAGALVGPFLLNAVFARRAGVRYRPILDWHDEGLREWVRLSLPLMIGVSLVTADNWIIAHFASGTSGAISLMTYAKRLFTAPMSVLAQAAGAASMPFFASLWAKEKRTEFATAVADSVSRVACMGLLVASAMVVLGEPLIDVVFVGGRFSRADAAECAAYFAVFSLSLFLWSAQSIYSRAFYAAGNTFAPMAAGTIITLISLPLYAGLYRTYGAMGLAVASDIGIGLQTLTIAVLLHKRRMVSLASLDLEELGRCLLAGVVSGAAVWLVFNWLLHALGLQAQDRWAELGVLVVGGALWLVLADWILRRTGSALPRVVRKRMGLA